jgi:glyoxylate/hydroxypyruvate reductase A
MMRRVRRTSSTSDQAVSMPNVVIRVDPERRSWWQETLRNQLPGYQVFLWDEDEFDNDEIDFAVVWMPPLGMLSSLRNLRAVFSVGAGVAHILRDPDYPEDVPIIRTTSEDLRKRMAEYIALHVLRFHRRLPEIEAAHAARTWTQYVEPLAKDFPVGLLGLGNLGAFIATTLGHLDYPINGWSRRGRPVEGVSVHEGESGLTTTLGSSRVVIAVLPGTSATEDLLDRKRLGAMREGSYLINVGRGECVVEADLVDALNDGHLAGATLDVFREEPLPADSPLWTAQNVLVTCHTASAIEPATGGRVISSNILAFEAGDAIADTVDLAQGY